MLALVLATIAAVPSIAPKLGSEGKAGAFSAAARQRAKTLFDPEELVGRYEDYYMQILEKNGVSAEPERNG